MTCRILYRYQASRFLFVVWLITLAFNLIFRVIISEVIHAFLNLVNVDLRFSKVSLCTGVLDRTGLLARLAFIQ